MLKAKTMICKQCGKEDMQHTRGRNAVYCRDCMREKVKAYKRKQYAKESAKRAEESKNKPPIVIEVATRCSECKVGFAVKGGDICSKCLSAYYKPPMKSQTHKAYAVTCASASGCNHMATDGKFCSRHREEAGR